jgi:hypothetical protein
MLETTVQLVQFYKELLEHKDTDIGLKIYGYFCMCLIWIGWLCAVIFVHLFMLVSVFMLFEKMPLIAFMFLLVFIFVQFVSHIVFVLKNLKKVPTRNGDRRDD